MVSVESLLSEVTPLFNYQLILKAADELFFGDKVLYHHHSNAGSKKGKSGSGGPELCKGIRNKQKDESQDDSMCERRAESDGLHDAIARARNTLKQALHDEHPADDEIKKLHKEVALLKKTSLEMQSEIGNLREEFKTILNFSQKVSAIPPSTLTEQSSSNIQQPLASEKDDFDLFGSSDDEEDVEKERVKEARLKAYAEKKAKKPECIAKSSIILDVKPWDDTTDMREMEKHVRKIEKGGLVWGGAKLIPLAYGIKVLQIICVVEDNKVSVDDLIDQITEEVSDYVQSVDIVAFNKI